MNPSSKASNFVAKHLDGIQPTTAIVLGSGLHIEADSIHCQFKSSEIPGFVNPKVAGHTGQVTVGIFEDHEILLMQGRVHYYEGIPSDHVTFQARFASELNIKNIIFMSAAGGISKSLNLGSMMLVKDHICAQPLPATSRNGSVYDSLWTDYVVSVCNDPLVSSGVYVWTLGPSYETPSEILAFERRGGDAVGMSLVPEALEASALGMCVLAVAVITNPAAGLSGHQLSHEGVLHAANNAQAGLGRLLAVALDHQL